MAEAADLYVMSVDIILTDSREMPELNWYRCCCLYPEEYHGRVGKGKPHSRVCKSRCVGQQNTGLSEPGPVLFRTSITLKNDSYSNSCT